MQRADALQTDDIELALGRVVVGYRIVGALWLGILGVVTLAGSRAVAQPVVVVVTMVGVALWAALTGVIYARSPQRLRTLRWIGADVAVTIWVLFSGDVAGSANFYGGYAMSSVFLGVYTFGLSGGLATATTLAGATLIRLFRLGFSDPTETSSAVLIYLFAGAIAGWAVGVIRANDRARRAAEYALAAERASRARAEERADVAAHLHDSVLQTLAMIQRTDRTDETRALARRQERELRAWLFGDPDRGTAPSFAVALGTAVAEIEDDYGLRLETVVVGDAVMSRGLEALISAGREAMVNVGRHAGVDEASVYAEVKDGQATLFVRDRGKGFDLSDVGSDRRGIAESIRGRLERHGGSATVKSRPGGGTEVIMEVAL